ncbi:MAG: hypothetical protein K2M67_05630, partial [Muribaculaceae bacterium]|nr:hypothetical protein [Muribaculaceae bacterium]
IHKKKKEGSGLPPKGNPDPSPRQVSFSAASYPDAAEIAYSGTKIEFVRGEIKIILAFDQNLSQKF